MSTTKSKKFIPPKLEMGPDFTTANSIKARNKSSNNKKNNVNTPISSHASKRRLVSKQVKDSIPLTLQNLALYFDWRQTSLAQAPTLYKIASTIWQYIDYTKMEYYSINLEQTETNEVIDKGGMGAPPTIVTTSPKGDLLIMVETNKKIKVGDEEEDSYSEKQFLLILYPNNSIYNIQYIGDDTVKNMAGTHCTYWEFGEGEGIEHLTHIAMDKYGIIYFTSGESVYRISKTEGDLYLDTFEDIFSPSNDTSHITSLWRQQNDIFLTIQDWDNEENLDVYKLIPPKDRGINTPDTPNGTQRKNSRGGTPKFGHARSNSGSRQKRTRTRSGSGYGSDFGGYSPRGKGTANDSNEFVNKVRTFSLSANARIWQLGAMNFQKKFVLGMGAAQKANKPSLLQIGFKKKIKSMSLDGNKGKGDKNVVWPKSAPEDLPHSIFNHKATKSWFCILCVTHLANENKLYWLQFKMDKAKKKIVWQRLVEVPECAMEGDWLYFDEIRDCLIGFKCTNASAKEYVFKYLPDMTKYLWIHNENDEKKENAEEPMMQRGIKNRRKSKEKISDSASGKLRRTSSGRNVSNMSNEPNIKPSKLKRTSSSNKKPKLKNNNKKSSNANKFRRTKTDKKSSKKMTKKQEIKPKKIKTQKTPAKKKKPLTPTPIKTEIESSTKAKKKKIKTPTSETAKQIETKSENVNDDEKVVEEDEDVMD